MKKLASLHILLFLVLFEKISILILVLVFTSGKKVDGPHFGHVLTEP